MTDLLAYEFVQNAVAAGLLAAVLCGVIGTFVVVRRLVFLGGGVSHAAFGGLGACYFLGADPRLGAAAAAVTAALVLGRGERDGRRSHDAAIGILWAVGMALGIVFIHTTPGYAPDLMTYLFGNILTVSRGDVLLLAGMVATVLLLIVLLYKELVAVSFDEEYAAVQGVPVRWLGTLLLVLMALSMVFLIQLVGIILVLALLTIPTVIALELAHRFGRVMLLSTGIGAAMTLGGLAVSYALDQPSGPAIVLVGAAALLAVAGAKRRILLRPARNRAPAGRRSGV